MMAIDLAASCYTVVNAEVLLSEKHYCIGHTLQSTIYRYDFFW